MVEATRSLSKIIKGYRVENQPLQSPGIPAGPAAGSAPVRGLLPRERVQVVNLPAPTGAAALRGQAGAAGTASVGSLHGGAVAAMAVAQAAGGPAMQERVDTVLARAQAKADLMVRQAEEKAELLIDRAVEGAQSIIDEARQAAHDEGYQEGVAAGRQAADELVRQAEAIRAEAEAEQERLFAASREKVVELALTVARQLIRQSLGQDPQLLLPLVDEALNHVHGEETATLRVEPAAAAALESEREALASRHGLGELRLIGDASLPPGDLQVNTPSGSVDVQIDRQLESLHGSLAEVVRHG